MPIAYDLTELATTTLEKMSGELSEVVTALEALRAAVNNLPNDLYQDFHVRIAIGPPSGPPPAWLGSQGRQLMELILSSGHEPTLTLAALMEMATGYPLSTPPKWCATGCALSQDGFCTIPQRSLDAANNGDDDSPKWDRLLAEQQRWDSAHEWDHGQPVHGILYDCPCYQAPG